MKPRIVFTLFALAATTLAGCTRSMDYEYHPNTYTVTTPHKASIGVVRLEDKRSWVEGDNEKSQSYIMSAGLWKFGLTEKDKDYTPVGTIIRDILIEEMTADGLKAKPVDQTQGESVADAARKNQVDYVMTGDVQAFEVMNESGWVTIDSRRQVNINLSLYNAAGQLVDGPNNYANNAIMNEGMGVMHSTNVDKLFNEVLKPVMKRVIERVQTRVAGVTSLKVNVAINGTVYSHTYNMASL